MFTLNIIKTFYYELIDFLVDIKNLFTKILSDLHHFLNRFMADEVILVFFIALCAFIAILIFRAVINKR